MPLPLFDVCCTYTVEVTVITQYEAKTEQEAFELMRRDYENNLLFLKLEPECPGYVDEFSYTYDEEVNFDILEF